MYVAITRCKGIQQSLNWILDSTPWISHSRQLIPLFVSGTIGFWILILSRILDSMSCIPDSKAQDSGFHKQKFDRMLNLDSLTWGHYLNKLFLISYCCILGSPPFCSWLKKIMQTWWVERGSLKCPLAVDIIGYMERSGCPFPMSSEFLQLPQPPLEGILGGQGWYGPYVM